MTLFELKNYLLEPKKIGIIIHQNPDGDALGSALGLKFILRNLGHEVIVFSPNSIGNYLMWMEEADSVVIYDENRQIGNRLLKSVDFVFCLDFNDINRTGPMEPILTNLDKPMGNIDHHLFPSHFADFEYLDSDTPATAYLVFRLIEELEWKNHLDASVARVLYTGILTDTGSFRFSSMIPDVHRVAGELIAFGIQQDEIFEKIYDSYSLSRLKLFGHCIANQQVLIEEKQTSYMYVTLKDEKDFNIIKGDTEGLVNFNLSIEGVKLGVLFIENDDLVKISFRSKGDFPTNEFARRYFEGGGHLNAAGGRSRLPLQDTINKFIDCLYQFDYE